MKRFVLAVVLALGLGVFAALPASAESGTREAEITYRCIKIVLDGQEICPRDAKGNEVEPFILDGTTYLPVRAVAEALGLAVRWRGSDSTVMLASDEYEQVVSATPTDLVPPEPPRKAESASGHNAVESVTLAYRDVRVLVDGVVIQPKDAGGNAVEPFILNGTTYLPVRAVADALGLAVDWDAETGTVRLSHWLVAQYRTEARDSSGELLYQYEDKYEYDEFGRVTHNFYDDFDSFRGRINLSYDEAGRLVSCSITEQWTDETLSSDTVYSYSGESGLCVSAELKEISSGESKRRTGSAKYEYDGLGRLVRAEESLHGRWSEWTYDEAGRVTELREKGADYITESGMTYEGEVSVMRFRYDENGRLVECDDGGGIPERFTYDGDGRLLSSTWYNMDSERWEYTWRYDENGRLIRMEGRLKGELDYAVDYSYDGRGLLIREETVSNWNDFGDRYVEVYTYDENGNLIRSEETTDRRTTVTTWEYVKVGG